MEIETHLDLENQRNIFDSKLLLTELVAVLSTPGDIFNVPKYRAFAALSLFLSITICPSLHGLAWITRPCLMT